MDDEKNNVIDDYFIAKENQLVCKQEVKISMATLNKDITMADCLFYIVKVNSSRLLL